MSNSNYRESSLLNASLTQVQQLLTTWSYDVVSRNSNIFLTFGQAYNQNTLADILQGWQNQDFSLILPITILTSEQLNGSLGAFSAQTNTIYLSSALIAEGDINYITRILLEEIGHKVDSVINTTDAQGDEGAIFASVVLGENLSTETLQAIQSENDHATITLDGQVITVENADFIGTAGNDNLIGTADNDYMEGLAGNDTLSGLGGDDTLIGGTGNDSLNGGDGYDFALYINATGSVTVNLETGTASGADGNDTLVNIEDVTGSNFNDSLVGGNNNDVLLGWEGNDQLVGGLGDDVLLGEDRWGEVGGTGQDTLSGGEGNDWLKGGIGNDSLDGGNGDDFTDYVSATGAVTVNLVTGTASGADGNDTLVSIEKVRGSTFNDNIIGNSADNYLDGIEGNDTVYGNEGNDILYGHNGDDLLYAGIGNDELWGENDNDKLYGEAGNDFLHGQPGNDQLDGGLGNDELWGDEGNDILNGGKGSDTMNGGAGNDTYYVDRLTDIIIDSGGKDTVRSFISYTLDSNLENLILAGSANLNGTGNTAKNKLTGNSGANTLIGDVGNDTLTGGAGNDSFRFNAKTEGIDTITDFNVANDTIVVAKSGFSNDLTANAVITTAQFTLGASATTTAQRFGYNATNGSLWFDSDGNGSTASIQFATLSTGLALTNADIFVV